jgi:hypothetical protein
VPAEQCNHPSDLHKLGLVTLIGVTASLVIDGEDANRSVWIIAGAILAPCVSSPKTTPVP